MKISVNLLTALMLASTAVVASGQAPCKPVCAPDASNVYNRIPNRAVVIYGDPTKADSAVLAVYYSREYLDFNDPDAPCFMLLDR